MIVLEVNNVNKKYKKLFSKQEIVAVNDISFQVNAGEVVGLLGPNGAGKSTLIKMIVGLALPQKGSIKILGNDISKNRVQAIEGVGAVIEMPDMYKNNSAKWILEYFATLHDKDSLAGGEKELQKIEKKSELNKARVQQVLELVQLSERQKSKVKTFSMGMKQRLGLAQALLNHPSLLILDEPANGLDPSGIKEVRNLLRFFAKEYNMAVLVSSHQLSEMEIMCDRVIILDKGKKISELSIKDTLAETKGLTEYTLTCSDIDKAVALLEDKFSIKPQQTEGKLVFSTDIKKSLINKELVMQGIEVDDFVENKQTLEDIFLQATNTANKWGI